MARRVLIGLNEAILPKKDVDAIFVLVGGLCFVLFWLFVLQETSTTESVCKSRTISGRGM